MAIPLIYNIRSIRNRWSASVVAILGIAGTVTVFVAMLALSRGFVATVVASGSTRNALIMRAGATSELESSITREQVEVISSSDVVERDGRGPLVSAENVVIAAMPMRSTGTDANVQLRGVSPRVLDVRPNIHVVKGRFLRQGLPELVVGRNASEAYESLRVDDTIRLGGRDFRVVGVFDSGGTAFDSEVWLDASVLTDTFKRPPAVYQAVTARLASSDALNSFKDALTSDPRMTVQVWSERAYYEKQSRLLARLINVLGVLVAVIMGVGAVFGALNTMYTAVAERGREIGTLRALGFSPTSILASFVVESMMIATTGGILGAVLVLPVNGLTSGTMNWATFTHLSFAFSVTPDLLLVGLLFALLMGLLGGVPPAIRAVRTPITAALRQL